MQAMEHLTRRGLICATSQMFAAAALLGRSAWAAAPSSQRIKCAQIGTAHAHAAGKMATLRKYPDIFQIVGIVEPDEERRARPQRHAAYDGVPFITIRQLLDTSGLALVVVETELDQLVPTAQTCIDAGAHVHLDKPPGRTMAPLRRLLASANAAARTVQIGYMFRYNPAFEFCFRAVREGWLGKIGEVHGVISKKATGEARTGVAPEPGGTMFELGCHLIDSMVSVLGAPQAVTPFTLRTQPDGLADDQLAVFRYPRATATIRSSINDPMSNRHFTVVGDEGTLRIDPLEPPAVRLGLSRAHGEFRKGWQQVALPKMAGRYDGDLLDLAAVIRGERPFAFSTQHDLAVHEAVLRASELPAD